MMYVRSCSLIFGTDVGLSNVVELSVEDHIIIDYVFDVGVDLFWNVVVFVLPSAHQKIHGLDLVTLGHLVLVLIVLAEQVVLQGEEEDDEEEEVLGSIGDEDSSCVDHVSWIGWMVPMFVMMER